MDFSCCSPVGGRSKFNMDLELENKSNRDSVQLSFESDADHKVELSALEDETLVPAHLENTKNDADPVGGAFEVEDGKFMLMMHKIFPGDDDATNFQDGELCSDGDLESCGGSVRARGSARAKLVRLEVGDAENELDDAVGAPPAFVNALATWLPESFDSGQARTLDQLGLFGRALGAVGGLWRAFGPWRAPGAEFGPLTVSSPAVVCTGTEPFVYK